MPSSDKQTQQQSQQSQTAPWAPTTDLLKNILGKYSGLSTDPTAAQTNAAGNLTSATSNIPNFGDAASGALGKLFGSDTTGLQGMLSGALGNLNTNLGGTASGAELNPYSTPGFSDALGTLTNDITNQVKGVYAGSGRSPSGAGSFAGSLGRGLTQGLAPVLQSQFNQNKANQMNAANTIFGGAGSTASGIAGLQQMPLENAMKAIGLIPSAAGSYAAPGAAQLDAANTAFGLPFANLQQLLSPVSGIAGLGGQSTGSGTTTTTIPQSTASNILGGVTGGLGLLKLLSDKDAKKNIEPVGKLFDGKTVYRYEYLDGGPTHIGLLSQEMLHEAPAGTVENIGGLLHLDYHRATERAARMAA